VRVSVVESVDWPEADELLRRAPVRPEGICPGCGHVVRAPLRADADGDDDFLAACFALAGRLLDVQYELPPASKAELLSFRSDEVPGWIGQLLRWCQGAELEGQGGRESRTPADDREPIEQLLARPELREWLGMVLGINEPVVRRPAGQLGGPEPAGSPASPRSHGGPPVAQTARPVAAEPARGWPQPGGQVAAISFHEYYKTPANHANPGRQAAATAGLTDDVTRTGLIRADGWEW